jgi:hypothetical protein
LKPRQIVWKNVIIGQEFFNIFIVILRDFVLSRDISNLRWTRALRIKADPASEGQKQLKGEMGVGVPISRMLGVGVMVQ